MKLDARKPIVEATKIRPNASSGSLYSVRIAGKATPTMPSIMPSVTKMK